MGHCLMKGDTPVHKPVLRLLILMHQQSLPGLRPLTLQGLASLG